MICREHNNRYTVITANEFVVNQESRPRALSILKQRGLSHNAAERLLASKASDAEWRSTFVQASSAVALACEAALGEAASTAEVDGVRQSIAQLSEQVKQRERADEIERLKAHLRSEYQRLVERHGSEPTAAGQQMFWDHLHSTAAGRRLAALAELEAQNESS